MTMREYTVRFYRTALGRRGASIRAALRDLVARHGQHLPEVDIGNDRYQMRDLTLVGTVWKGVFALLRNDAPNVVDGTSAERPLELNDGDRLVEKCHFLYRTRDNLLVWQFVKGVGAMTIVQRYLSELTGDLVALPQIMNEEELARIMNGDLKEIQFSYARPAAVQERSPGWSHHAFDMMESIGSATAKFMLRAPRAGALAQRAKAAVRELVRGNGVDKVRVYMTDDTEPIDLFMAPLKGSMRVELLGRYPIAAQVYTGLENAYDQHRGSIPAWVPQAE